MFDVHILSIYVDICYISVLIKYFFPWMHLDDRVMKRGLFRFSSVTAPQHS